MKLKFPCKSLLALSVAIPALAHAQSSVTLYGIIDEGLNYQSNAGGPARYSLASGVLQGSRWGLKGKEDLGSGYAAIFVLENGFDVNTGALGQGSRMFGRQAYVGLSSDRYGSIMLGRQYDSLVTSIGDFAVGDQWGGYIAAHPGDLDNFNNTFRVNNAIKYASANYGGFSFSATYAPGGIAGDVTGNQIWAVGANYAGAGLRVGAAYLNARTPNQGLFGNSSATALTSASASLSSPVTSGFISAHDYGVAAVAASYDFAQTSVGFTYSNTRFSGLGNLSAGTNPLGYRGAASFNNVEVNGKYQLTPAFLVGAAYDYTVGGSVESKSGEKPDARYHQFAIGADYFLSKRTDLYLTGIYQKASGVDSRGVIAVAAINNVTPASGNHVGLVRVGIRHKF
ncbi:porin [Paraburkholderia xenovorans]|uniref:porin n=1 Tax=Paraburkholderia xenovorans TaxID=36873 RepID=UPI0038B709B1